MKSYSRTVDPKLENNKEVDVGAVDNLINERALARESKDFRRADNILKFLLERHSVIVNDSDCTWQTGTKKEVKKRKRKRIALSRTKGAPVSVGGSREVAREGEFRLSSDSGPNESPFSSEEIVDLLAKRRTAQQTRDYEFADSVRNTLKANGVYVDDGQKEFRWDGLAYRQRGRACGGERENRQSRIGRSDESSWGLRRSEHSLALDDDSMRTVEDLLAQRSDARSSRNYAASDAIRDELFERFDIRIDDALRKWSAGGDFGAGDDHWTKTAREPLVGYSRSDASAPLPPSEERYIQRRVDERMRAKRTRNYELCDAIRDELYSEYDVTIHDKMNLWSAGGDFGEGISWNHNINLVKEKVAREDEDGDDFHSQDLEDGAADARSRAAAARGRESAMSPSRERLERLTVVQLKDELRGAGLTIGGTKAKLIDRLLAGEN